MSDKISAVIFDLDGTIVDDENIWEKAFQKVADRLNLKLSVVENSWPIPGRSLADSWKVAGETVRAEELAIMTREEFRELIEDMDNLEPRPGFDNLIEVLRENGYLIGLCTSSYWEVADLLLNKMSITGIFDAITTGEEVVRVKPDPEIYRLMCQKLGVEPEEVMVFEDAEAGIMAAQSCGCNVLPVGVNYNFSEAIEMFVKRYE